MTRRYVFSDESGNFDFRPHETVRGPSQYFAVGTVMVEGDEAVAALAADLGSLRRALLWNGVGTENYFHASEDKQAVRDAVFEVLSRHPIRVDVTMIEKAKALPRIRTDDPTFFKYAWYYHFKMLAQRTIREGDELMVVTASIGTKRMRAAFQQAVEDVVTQCCPWHVSRRIGFWDMATEPCLQAADYALWAVMRKWEQGDERALEQVRPLVRSQYDLFAPGRTYHYGPNSSEASAS